MAISWPFDSTVTSDTEGNPIYSRAYSADVLSRILQKYFSNGVFNDVSTGLQVVEATGMTVTVKAGDALINGKHFYEESDRTLAVQSASAMLDRIDTVVVRLNLALEALTIDLYVVEGTPAATPTAPSLTRNASVYELGIANLFITKNTTTISQAKITDTRLDSDRCGVVASIIGDTDTSTYYAQIAADLASFKATEEAAFAAWSGATQDSMDAWIAAEQAAFNAWFAAAQDTLGDDAAGALLNLINENAFMTYLHSKSGTNHELTLAGGNTNIKFIATANFAAGDTFTVNGTEVTAKMPDGNDLSDGYFISGAVVIGFLNGSTIYFVGGGAMNSQIIITLAASDSASMAGRTVVVKNTEDGEVLESFIYSGQPQTVLVPVGAHYRVECSEVQNYVTPAAVEFTAIANTPRAITMQYRFGTRFGFKREKANSAKSARITYLFDAVGKTPTAMNFTTGAFDAGSWESFINAVARPVMLKADGTVDYALHRENQSYKADGTTDSDVANTSYNGNAMVEFGSAFKWVKRYEDSTHEYVIFSDVQYDSDCHAYAHTDGDGNVKDAFYWGMFKGPYIGTKMRSIGTGAVIASTTRQDEINRAQANGTGYFTIYKSGHDYIDDLLTLISKSDDTQTAFGKGRSKSSNTAAIANGTLKAFGGFKGYTDATSDVKVFWIAGYWGNVRESMAGLILDGANGIKTKMAPPYNITGSGYHATGVVPSGTSGGFINTHSTTDADGFVPKTASGSETTYICDGLWFNNGQVDYTLVGGSWPDAGHCGSRGVYLSFDASFTFAAVGSRLSYITPLPEAA